MRKSRERTQLSGGLILENDSAQTSLVNIEAVVSKSLFLSQVVVTLKGKSGYRKSVG